MTSTDPILLTVIEAAALARCSVKTVRRAYATGALVAYRRRGSRAVLLDKQDVLEWAQGQVVEPTKLAPAGDSVSVPSQPRRTVRQPRTQRPAPRFGSAQRADLSVNALRDRRGLKIQSLF